MYLSPFLALLIDVAGGTASAQQLPDDVTYSAFAISPDGEQLVAATGKPPGLAVWDLEDIDKGGTTLPFTEYARDVAFSPNGEWLAAAGSSSVSVWRTEKPGEPASVIGHRGVSAVAFHRDEPVLGTASYGGQAAVWKLPEGRLIGRLLPHTGQVSAIEFIPDSSLVLTSSGKIVRMWDYRVGETVAQPLRDGGKIAVGPRGMTISTGSYDKSVRIWQVKKRGLVHFIQQAGQERQCVHLVSDNTM